MWKASLCSIDSDPESTHKRKRGPQAPFVREIASTHSSRLPVMPKMASKDWNTLYTLRYTLNVAVM